MMRVVPRLQRGGRRGVLPFRSFAVAAFRVAQRRVTGSSTPPEKQVRDASHRHGWNVPHAALLPSIFVWAHHRNGGSANSLFLLDESATVAAEVRAALRPRASGYSRRFSEKPKPALPFLAAAGGWQRDPRPSPHGNVCTFRCTIRTRQSGVGGFAGDALVKARRGAAASLRLCPSEF